MTNTSARNKAAFIWSIADILRGTYDGSQYGRVILPFTVLRRFDCVVQDNQKAVLEKLAKGLPEITIEAEYPVYNTTKHTLTSLLDDPANLRNNLRDYLEGFPESLQSIFENYEIGNHINKLSKGDLLFPILRKFVNEVDLHPSTLNNADMGAIFEELIRKFTDNAAAADGEYFTPRDAIHLLTRLIFVDDKDVLAQKGIIRSIYDPTVGTGGMLSVAEEVIKTANPLAAINLYGQELNPNSYSICLSDIILKGGNADQVQLGNTLTDDKFAGRQFDYALSNPPYGVDWKHSRDKVEAEAYLGDEGRFGFGLPAVSDGQLLFLCHLISKMKPGVINTDDIVESAAERASFDEDERETEAKIIQYKAGTGSRVGIVMNGSSLFSGGAGSGASSIREYLFENDLVEAIVALPTHMFYNTGIPTYFWILDNTKSPERQGKVQLIDASNIFTKMRKSLGEKTKEFNTDDIQEIVHLYTSFKETDESKIFDNNEMGYSEYTTFLPRKIKLILTDDKLAGFHENSVYKKLKDDKKTVVSDVLASLLASQKDGDKPLEDINSWDSLKELIKARGDSKNPPQSVVKMFVDLLAEDDNTAEAFLDKDGKPLQGDKDSERVDLTEDLDEYLEREVYPHAPDTVVDLSSEKIGYEIPFTRIFYKYEKPRSVEVIDEEINKQLLSIVKGLAEIEGRSPEEIVGGV